MVKQTKTNEHKTNPLLWFLFAIVIPVIVALTLLVIILFVSGVDVGGWAKQTGKNIPVIEKLIPSDKEADTKAINEEQEAEISNKDNEIQSLNEEINSLEKHVEDLERENTKLEHEVDKKNENAQKEEHEQPESSDLMKTLSQSFKDMNTKQAAQILKELDNDTAISLLRELPTDVRGEILAKMDSKTAAKMSKLFLEQ